MDIVHKRFLNLVSKPMGPKKKKKTRNLGRHTTRQKSFKNPFKGGAIKETMGRLIEKVFIYDSVTPHKENSHSFKNMIVGAQLVSM